jgi:hypothetical protein
MTINWQDVIVTVFTTVGGGTVLLGSAAYLIKTALTHRLAQETETFKSQLKANSDAEIERLKSSLQMTALEHQVRFSKLHEQRAQVIAELYQKLVTVFRTGKIFTLMGSGRLGNRKDHNERYQEAHRKLDEFMTFVEENRIYIPTRVCDILDAYSFDLASAVHDVGIFGGRDYEGDSKDQQDAFDNAYRKFQNDIPSLKKLLESEFRIMLGEVPEANA